MANQITDNRTSLTTAETATGFDDLAGAASGTADSEIFIQGSNSVGYYTTTTRAGLLYDTGTTNDWSNTVFYIWFNCGVAGLLDTKANGGVTVRFCGNTVTDFYEVYVAGGDNFPTAVSGGWVQFAVDATVAHSNSDNTGGTKPATTALRYVGVSTITASTMPRMVDNTWVDQIAYLGANTAGIIVEGRNGGSTDWDFADIVTQLGVGVGTAKNGPGGSIVLNTPVQFGINDTTTHGFSDSNATVLWDEQEFVPDGFYGLSALGNSGGTTNVKLGVKSGTGNDATGAQGGSITAAPTGSRWFMDFNDANLDAVGFYGVSMAHGEDFLLDDPSVEFISCIMNDCNSATVSNSLMLKNTIVDANTADGVAFMTTDDIGDIRFCDFQFSDGHAIELTTPRVASQTSTGNRFTGYAVQAGNANDRAIYNNTAGAVTISAVSGASSTEHSYRNGTSATTTVTANITVTYTGIATNTEVRIYKVSDGSEEDGVENSTTSFAATLQSGVAYDVQAINPGYKQVRFENQTYTADTTVNLNQQTDLNFNNP